MSIWNPCCCLLIVSAFFGPYGPYSPFAHHSHKHKPPPFIIKHHKLEHIPYKGAGLRLTQKHLINKTALCALRGGECTEPINCVGMQQFFCDTYTTTCCFNRTKHVKFRKKHRIKDFINRTALCFAKGGICSGAGTCIGSQQFSCLDQSETCCFNTSTDEVIIKKIIYPSKRYKLKPHGHIPRLKKPHARGVKGFIFSHTKAKSGLPLPRRQRQRSFRRTQQRHIETIELYDYE